MSQTRLYPKHIFHSENPSVPQAIGKNTIIIQTTTEILRKQILPWISDNGLKKLSHFPIQGDYRKFGFKFASKDDMMRFKLTWG
jgi:hypothetical protein